LAADMPIPHVYLGHGASGTAASMRPHVEGLRRRGIEATAVDLPKGSAERALPAYARQVGDALPRSVVGGHSFGGRVASMLAAEQGAAGLVLLSYPLHRPGHPEELRVQHWPRIRCPVLLLSGEADPFARVDLLRVEVARMPGWTLHTYPGVQHGLQKVLDDALDRVGDFVRELPG
jgi:predicted alpha/beta-hydrolase family hydrolase